MKRQDSRKDSSSAVRDFSDRVLDGLRAPFVAYYAESRALSPEDLVQLEQIAERQRRKGGP